MKVLIACEFSGIVRDAFLAKGHDAWSCDLLPCESPITGRHYQCDVRTILHKRWDCLICHPDCTYICNSGVRWLDNPKPGHKVRDGILTGPERWRAMYQACEFFKMFLNHDCKRICVENPIPHLYSLGWIGKDYTQTIQPWEHGDPYTKRTCLWLKGLPELTPTLIVPEHLRIAECHNASPGEDRGKDRSLTYSGVAKAMADAWG